MVEEHRTLSLYVQKDEIWRLKSGCSVKDQSTLEYESKFSHEVELKQSWVVIKKYLLLLCAAKDSM